MEEADLWDFTRGGGGPFFGPMIDELRTVQDLATGALPPDEVTAQVAARLAEVAALLAPYQVEEGLQAAGRRPDLTGRGQTLVPPLDAADWSPHSATGTVTFTRFHLGGNGAAHGGSIALLFDEILGHLAHADGSTRSRTAYLQVNYRSIARVDVPLRLVAGTDRTEGRKRWMSATLHDGDTPVADAEGLWVTLRPGQP